MSKTSKETAAVMRPEESQRDENQQTSAPARKAPLVEIAAFANPHDSHETTGVAPTPEADFEIDPEFSHSSPSHPRRTRRSIRPDRGNQASR